MRFACWITKATDTHSECVILLVVDISTKYFVARERCKVNALLRYAGNNVRFDIVDSNIYAKYDKQVNRLFLVRGNDGYANALHVTLYVHWRSW